MLIVKKRKINWTVINEVELVYVSTIKPSARPQVKSSNDAFTVFRSQWNHGTLELRVEIKVLLLDQSNRALGVYTLSKGGITGTIADMRLLFSAALKARAVFLMIACNSPSGALQPSETDKGLAQKIGNAGKVLDLKLLDYLIITPDSYFSFADEGLL
jgi:DNA repair protein RadC